MPVSLKATLGRFLKCFLRAFSPVPVLGLALALLTFSQCALAWTNEGRLLEPFTIDGKTIPAGSYIIITDDDGDTWLAELTRDYTKIVIPKTSVQLIAKTSYTPPPLAVVNQQTQMYGAVSTDPTTLTPPYPGRLIQKGEKLRVIFQEGGTYFVSYDRPDIGPTSFHFRVSTSAVDIVPGQVYQAENVVVAPAFFSRFFFFSAIANTPYSLLAAFLFVVVIIASYLLSRARIAASPPLRTATIWTTGPVSLITIVLLGVLLYVRLRDGTMNEPVVVILSFIALVSTACFIPAYFFGHAGRAIARAEARKQRAEARKQRAEAKILAAKQEAERQRLQPERDRLFALLDKRFPPDAVFRVPAKITHDGRLLPDDVAAVAPFLREDYDQWWRRLIDLYPKPPQDDVEREQREEEFWQNWCNHFTITNAQGQPVLKPKQDVLDYFRSCEKWIFREYYAATGIVNQTIAKSLVEQMLELSAAIKNVGWYKNKGINANSNNPYFGRAEAKVEALEDAIARFARNDIPAHLEKWGGWFYFHIQEAFNRQHEGQSDFGPQSATTPTQHPAQDDLSYKPNA